MRSRHVVPLVLAAAMTGSGLSGAPSRARVGDPRRAGAIAASPRTSPTPQERRRPHAGPGRRHRGRRGLRPRVRRRSHRHHGGPAGSAPAASASTSIRSGSPSRSPTRNGRGVQHLVRFIEQDVMLSDISEATVVTLYLLSSSNARLRPILTRQLRPGARIVSHAFSMGTRVGARRDRALRGRARQHRTLYLWRHDGTIRDWTARDDPARTHGHSGLPAAPRVEGNDARGTPLRCARAAVLALALGLATVARAAQATSGEALPRSARPSAVGGVRQHRRRLAGRLDRRRSRRDASIRVPRDSSAWTSAPAGRPSAGVLETAGAAGGVVAADG